MLNLCGDLTTIVGLYMPNVWHISFCEDLVAVAVRAIKFNVTGKNPRNSPSLENSFLKFFPLHELVR